jgi:hypothetical protein
MTDNEAQDAFVGLISEPLLTTRTNPELFRELLRHRTKIGDWAGRLGYRFVIAGSVMRLHRDPSGPQRSAAPPPWDTPLRRELSLTVLIAAACEGVDIATTVQELSDEVRALSASGKMVTPYDPNRRTERQSFIRGVSRLARLGVLLRRTSDESLLRQWEDEGTGVGAGFEIDREALLQFADPYTVTLAFDDSEPSEDERLATRGQRMLRILVEDTALIYSELHPADAEYARGQRSWLSNQATEMTGGTVEIRAEGVLLRLPDDRPRTAMAAPVFPAATAVSWFALKALDEATKGKEPDELGNIRVDPEIAIGRMYRDNHRALTVPLRESPARLRSAVTEVLAGLGLITVNSDYWTIRPIAGRYRDPKATWEQTLEDVE